MVGISVLRLSGLEISGSSGGEASLMCFSRRRCWFLGGAAMWIDLIDTMMHVEGQGEGGGSRVLAAMWLRPNSNTFVHSTM
jgi:hypothetical protein